MSERLLYIGKAAPSREIRAFLERKGYEVSRVEGLRPSLRALNESEYDLIIIDADDTSPINLHRITHTAGHRPTKPFVVILTSSRTGNLDSTVHDIVLVRPFTTRRLEKQIRLLIDSRRDYVVTLGPFTIDRRTHKVRTPKGLVRLTPKQFHLLDYLVRHPQQVISRRELMEQVWETSYLGDTRTLDVHVRWLREQIEPDPGNPQYLITHRGQGYCLAIDGPLEQGGEPLI
ncbi:MAG: DNA-binding response regulator [Chloroflexi bacterium]|nr:MAG: DNA-binding response regulator [Chloroflexota bacterium]